MDCHTIGIKRPRSCPLCSLRASLLCECRSPFRQPGQKHAKNRMSIYNTMSCRRKSLTPNLHHNSPTQCLAEMLEPQQKNVAAVPAAESRALPDMHSRRQQPRCRAEQSGRLQQARRMNSQHQSVYALARDPQSHLGDRHSSLCGVSCQTALHQHHDMQRATRPPPAPKNNLNSKSECCPAFLHGVAK